MINNDEPWTITVMNQGQSWVMTHHNHPRSSRFSQYWYGSFSFRMVFFCLKCQALRSCGARSDSHNSILNHNLINSTLWLFNIAMENGPFIAGLPVYLLKIVIFHGYVSHNQRVVPNEPGSIINHVYTPKAWVSIVSPACGLQSFSNGQGSPWIQLIIRAIISPIAPCTEIHGMTPESPESPESPAQPAALHHAAPTFADRLMIICYDTEWHQEPHHLTWCKNNGLDASG